MIGRTLGHYRITAHLGSGGMGEVYKAADTKLGRDVALKILPPELAADPSRRQRFEREARAVAALNHPNIVTVHSIESEGDLHFITMELVDGEPLATLVTKGPVAIERFFQIARPLAGALAAAHGRGVTHRDLKPANVMVTRDGSVKVLDFGLAKLSPSLADGTRSSVSTETASEPITKEGRVVGTLAYMSPEQAEGRPVDARTDVFALGVVMYELLSGRRPFSGDTTASLVAALLRDEPPALVESGREIPESLDRVVRRCLEKSPAHRYATASECLAELEHLEREMSEARIRSSASRAGTAGPAAAETGTPSIAPPSRRLATLLLYLPVAAAVWLGVRAATRVVGLPDWVAPGTLALLVIGALVLLLTARAQQKNARAWLTWRRATLGGVLAFAGLGALVVAFFVSRAAGIGPAASLVSSGALARNAEVLIADVEDLTDDALLGVAVKEALSIDLAQSSIVSIVPQRRVARAYARMQREAGTGLDLATAQEMAEREGIEAILAGRVSAAGSGYVLGVRLLDAETGEVLAAVRETASARDEVIPAIDELSRKLRNRIGESLRTTRDRAPLETVTTSSLDALQKYSRAVALTDNFDRNDEAAALLEEAVAIDTTFAMAYRKLGMVLRSMRIDRARSRDALSRAFALRGRLTERERLLAEAAYHGIVQHDADRAIHAYEAILVRDPDDPWALNNLGLLLSNDGRPREALRHFRRAESIDPSTIIADNLTYNYTLIGEIDSANAVVDRYQESFAEPWALYERMSLAAALRRYDEAERIARELLASSQSPSGRVQSRARLIAVLWTRGKLAEGRRLTDDELEEWLSAGEPGRYLEVAVDLAAHSLLALDEVEGARRLLDEALERVPLDTIPFENRPTLYLAVVRAAAGQLDVAHQLYTGHRREAEEIGQPLSPGAVRWVEGAFAYFEGRLEEALARFLSNAEEDPTDLGTRIWIARTHDALGDTDAAIAAWEHYVGVTDMSRLWNDYHYLGTALARLAELYETKGDLATARGYWGQLTELWRDADPELAPRVAHAEERYRRLASDATRVARD